MLLDGYDRSVAREAVTAAKKQEQQQAAQNSHETGRDQPTKETSKSAARARPTATSARMLDSDESELSSSSSDSEDAGGGARGSMSMQFFPDDARPVDAGWAARAGPTASAAAAQQARDIVDDDMERGGSSGARMRQQQAYARAREAQQMKSGRHQREHALASSLSAAADDAAAAADSMPSSSDLAWLSSELLRTAQRLFLDGEDGAFVRYELIDSGQAVGAEWWDQPDSEQAHRAQEAYFDQAEEEEQEKGQASEPHMQIRLPMTEEQRALNRRPPHLDHPVVAAAMQD